MLYIKTMNRKKTTKNEPLVIHITTSEMNMLLPHVVQEKSIMSDWVKKTLNQYPKKKIQKLYIENVLPTHELNESEQDFSDFYLSQYKFQSDERIVVPILLLSPDSFENLVTDITRAYESFNSETVEF